MGRYAVIESGVVSNIAEADADFAASQNWVAAATADIGWLYANGVLSPPVPPAKTPEEVQLDVVTKTQERLDAFAGTRNYAGILSLCTYAASSVTAFASEGQYGIQLRDATWSKCYEILAEVESGTRPLPSGYEEIAPELPTPQWPV